MQMLSNNNSSAMVARVIPASIWIPFMFLAIQTSKGLMFWVNLARGMDPTQVDTTQVEMEGSAIDRVVLSVLILLALWVMRTRGSLVLNLLKKNFILLLLMGFMLLSVLWSDFHMIALKRWVRLFGLFIMIMLAFTEAHPLLYIRKLLELLAGFLVIGSAILIFFFPSLGRDVWSSGEVQWVGLAVHKNMLGQYGALGSVFFLWRFFSAAGFGKKSCYLTIFALSGVLLFGSKSFTSITVTAVALAVLVGLELSKKLGRLGGVTILLLVAGTIFGGLMVQNNLLDKPLSSYFLEAGGKDVTFSGRTEIWKKVLKGIEGSEFAIGSGYESYWVSKKGDRVREALNWEFYSAHNGYLDLFLQLGAIGALLFAAYLISVLINLFKCSGRNYNAFILWSVFLLIAIASDFFESNFGVSSDIYWLMTLIAGISPDCFGADATEPDRASPIGTEADEMSDTGMLVS